MDNIILYEELSSEYQEAILSVVKKATNRIEVLDEVLDEPKIRLLVKFYTWQKGIIRCIIKCISPKQAAAFYYPESEVARKEMRLCLITINKGTK